MSLHYLDCCQFSTESPCKKSHRLYSFLFAFVDIRSATCDVSPLLLLLVQGCRVTGSSPKAGQDSGQTCGLAMLDASKFGSGSYLPRACMLCLLPKPVGDSPPLGPRPSPWLHD